MAILAGTVSNGTKSAGYVATVMLFLFNFFFAVGLLAIPWLRKFPSNPETKPALLTTRVHGTTPHHLKPPNTKNRFDLKST
jgi:hypothetical protein